MTAGQPYIKLSYTYNKDQSVDYKVRLVSVPSNLGIGKLWYFRCPETGKRCRKLYGAGKYFLHRDAFPNAMYEYQTYSKKMREMDREFSLYYSFEKLWNELHSKYFKTHYAGKPTKRFKKIVGKMKKIKSMGNPVQRYYSG